MKVERAAVPDQRLYEIMYFSPVHVGDERFSNQLYFQTDMFNRTWPQSMVDKLNEQIENLRHVELGMTAFDVEFKVKHRAAVLFHLKMALAYLDAREARIAMKLCKAAEPATRSTEGRLMQDKDADFDFLRITLMSVLACAARRVKFYETAVEALSEAKEIAIRRGEDVHPLLQALTLLNLSAVLGDMDHDEQGLRWGLESLTMLYSFFSKHPLPEEAEKFYLITACHNAALLNVKLVRWDSAIELWGEGMDLSKALGEADEDGLRRKLIAIGAQAKHVPEGFLEEAVNVIHGWGEEPDVWNLSFWDFTEAEIKEEIHVLRHTTTLRHLIVDHFDDRRHASPREDALLAQLILAAVSCQSLEQLTIASLEFDPRKVWRRIKKPTFLETSWYASSLNFANILEGSQKPETASFKQMLQNISHFSKKVILCLIVLGNECDAVDLSENCIDAHCITALVRALRWRKRPKFSRQVSTLILQSNGLDAGTTRQLAHCWEPLSGDEALEEEAVADLAGSARSSRAPSISRDPDRDKADLGVAHLDISFNPGIGDEGFEHLVDGIARYRLFRVLRADTVGLGPPGCRMLERLGGTALEFLCLANNAIGARGAEAVVDAALKCRHLQTLELENCDIDPEAATPLARLLRDHPQLKKLAVNRNRLGSEGVVELCGGASSSRTLTSLGLAYNGVSSAAACEALGQLMRSCSTLAEVRLSGNSIDREGAKQLGAAIQESRVLTVDIEDMGFDHSTIDEFLDHGSAETQELEVMRLSSNPIGDIGLAAISECLSIGLVQLSLASCGLTAKSRDPLRNLVSLSPNLKSLDLSSNDLGPTGCSEIIVWIAQSEPENFSLESLELANCSLGDEGFTAFVPVLGVLTYLGLRGNRITSAGLEAVMNSQQMIQLRCLDLSRNSIGEQGVHALTERFQQEHKRCLWNAKQLTSSIDQVILTENPIPSGLAASTQAYLKIHNPLLNVVWPEAAPPAPCPPGPGEEN